MDLIGDPSGSGSWISMPSERAPQGLFVVLAHPDDEFALFPWIEAAIDAGHPVHVAWLTDGAWGGQSAGRRQGESEEVLGAMGVQRRNMHFLGAEIGVPDSRLHEWLGTVIERLVVLVHSLNVAEIMVPAWEGGHQDHDATYLAGVALQRATGLAVWEFSLYHGFKLLGPFFTVLKPIPRSSEAETIETDCAHRLRYIRCCLRYQSQWKSFLGLLPFYIWRLRRSDAFQRRLICPELTKSKPHAGKLLYERRTNLSWEIFAEATARFRMGRQVASVDSPSMRQR